MCTAEDSAEGEEDGACELQPLRKSSTARPPSGGDKDSGNSYLVTKVLFTLGLLVFLVAFAVCLHVQQQEQQSWAGEAPSGQALSAQPVSPQPEQPEAAAPVAAPAAAPAVAEPTVVPAVPAVAVPAPSEREEREEEPEAAKERGQAEGQHKEAAEGQRGDDTEKEEDKPQTCTFVEGLDFYADNYLIDSKPTKSKEQCCKQCHDDNRCQVGMFREGRCYLKKVTKESESFSSRGSVACAVPGRSLPVDEWGPTSWKRDYEKCTKSRAPLPTISLKVQNKPAKLPPIAWRTFQAFAGVRRKRLVAESSHTAGQPFSGIEVALPLVLPTGTGDAKAAVVQGLVGLKHLADPGKRCVIALTNDGHHFDELADLSCEVHVFGCSASEDRPSLPSKSWTSHTWCIASGNAILQGDADGKKLENKGLVETLKLIHQDHLDVLRIVAQSDTWSQFSGIVHEAPTTVAQLSLRLCAGQKSAPSVASVFLELHDLGFWVVYISPVAGDCTESVLLNVGVGTSSGMPPVAWRAFEAVANKSHEKLVTGAIEHQDTTPHVFAPVDIALNFMPPIIDHDWRGGDGQGNKNLIGIPQLAQEGRKCVVYGIGISSDSAFEQKMAKMGCETHAFDCTISTTSEAVSNKAFTFHHWCIGEAVKQKKFGSQYVHSGDGTQLEFKTLSDTMQHLGHATVDVLKFDIEGFEWKLFEHVFLKEAVNIEQISFELHTSHASRNYVPKVLTECKDSVAVSRLFLGLYDLGYRVVSKEVNNGDAACAEFVLLNVKF